MRVLYHCGVGSCDHTGFVTTTASEWAKGIVQLRCPKCQVMLRQSELHFEDFNTPLQREREALTRIEGPLTQEQVYRLQEIHDLLGHGSPEDFTPEQESLVMQIASETMRRIRNEDKH